MRGVQTLRAFNLLIGCPRDRERAAKSEVQYFIGDLLGDNSLNVVIPGISGLLICSTTLDPFETVRRLKGFAIENPYQFRFAIRFTPMEQCVSTSTQEIVSAVDRLRHKILDKESFRVTVRRRHSNIDVRELIHATAALFSQRVDLEHPDKTIWIEVVGEQTGVSILQPEEDILSIRTMRDDIY